MEQLYTKSALPFALPPSDPKREILLIFFLSFLKLIQIFLDEFPEVDSVNKSLSFAKASNGLEKISLKE